MNFAVIVNGKVENLIVADSLEIAEEASGHTCVAYTDLDNPIIGLGYDGTTFEQLS